MEEFKPHHVTKKEVQEQEHKIEKAWEKTADEIYSDLENYLNPLGQDLIADKEGQIRDKNALLNVVRSDKELTAYIRNKANYNDKYGVGGAKDHAIKILEELSHL